MANQHHPSKIESFEYRLSEDEHTLLATTNKLYDGILIWDLGRGGKRAELEDTESSDPDHYIKSPDHLTPQGYDWLVRDPRICVNFSDASEKKNSLYYYQVARPLEDDPDAEIKSSLSANEIVDIFELPVQLSAFCLARDKPYLCFGVQGENKYMVELESGQMKKFGKTQGVSKSELEAKYNQENFVLFWSSEGFMYVFDVRKEDTPLFSLPKVQKIKDVQFDFFNPDQVVFLQEHVLTRFSLQDNSFHKEYHFTEYFYQKVFTRF